MGRDDFAILYSYEVGAVEWAEAAQAAIEECIEREAGILVVDSFLQFAKLEDENSAPQVLTALAYVVCNSGRIRHAANPGPMSQFLIIIELPPPGALPRMFQRCRPVRGMAIRSMFIDGCPMVMSSVMVVLRSDFHHQCSQ